MLISHLKHIFVSLCITSQTNILLPLLLLFMQLCERERIALAKQLLKQLNIVCCIHVSLIDDKECASEVCEATQCVYIFLRNKSSKTLPWR